MVDKQLDNNNLEPAVPESPELSDEQLDEASGGWNTYRDYYGVYCKKCRNIFSPTMTKRSG